MVTKYTRKNMENQMFLDDEFMTDRDIEAAIAFADMLDNNSDGIPWVAPGVRKRTPEEIEARILRMAILQVQQVEIRLSQNGTE